MAETQVILAVDQGTGSTRATSLTASGQFRQEAQVPLALHSPQPGWVEQDPAEILASVVSTLSRAASAHQANVVAVGLSSQRESALVWEHATGRPLSPLLGWQDRRTAGRVAALSQAHGSRVRALSGLPVDPMFSALKLEWILDQLDPDRKRAANGELRVGTVDSWLLRNLTGDDRIEIGNASRTQLLNVRTGDWDQELLDIFRIPAAALPPVVPSDQISSPITGYGELDGLCFAAVLGDSHAALFGHGVREPGTVKVTYGTGSSVMGLTPHQVDAESGLVETIAWQHGQINRAYEGNILSTGGTLVWLGKLLGRTPEELAEIGQDVAPSNNVDLVPAFAGLGAPWWDEQAHALIDGFDLGTGPGELARAALESIPLQIEDVLERADDAAGQRIATVLVDGGPARNDWLMSLQAELSDRTIKRPQETGLSALGAGALAGIASGVWSEDPTKQHSDEFSPPAERAWAVARRERWQQAVTRARLQNAIESRISA